MVKQLFFGVFTLPLNIHQAPSITINSSNISVDFMVLFIILRELFFFCYYSIFTHFILGFCYLSITDVIYFMMYSCVGQIFLGLYLVFYTSHCKELCAVSQKVFIQNLSFFIMFYFVGMKRSKMK